jgi:hypothetical protein
VAVMILAGASTGILGAFLASPLFLIKTASSFYFFIFNFLYFLFFIFYIFIFSNEFI